MELLQKELTAKIIKTFYDVYNELGYGFFEKVYQNSRKKIRINLRCIASALSAFHKKK